LRRALLCAQKIAKTKNQRFETRASFLMGFRSSHELRFHLQIAPIGLPLSKTTRASVHFRNWLQLFE
jgi:hypothetical protein